MLASDGTGDNPDKLDFYEVRFNKAFRSFRLDIQRQEIKRRKRFAPLPGRTTSQQAGTEEDVWSRFSTDLRTPPKQEDLLFRKELLETITALPEDERTTVTLRIEGYQMESSDPNKETIATLCNCTGRTVRNRLTRARAKLGQFKEKP
jgi:DNA-directed RNA polymerase specialized sigma24 family protein